MGGCGYNPHEPVLSNCAREQHINNEKNIAPSVPNKPLFNITRETSLQIYSTTRVMRSGRKRSTTLGVGRDWTHKLIKKISPSVPNKPRFNFTEDMFLITHRSHGIVNEEICCGVNPHEPVPSNCARAHHIMNGDKITPSVNKPRLKFIECKFLIAPGVSIKDWKFNAANLSSAMNEEDKDGSPRSNGIVMIFEFHIL
ncbi:hypothetical protein IGI04_006136 [Brassica rapa subsp. trilocularis]|uniref:Uncharacterized protein n=1 Tax=Brassica rapa subsp. trilocularis TaxID=1813537 RepID=A0ABQ7NFZ3_BRACM|nr:hypothetical protein IGI04_006136 [Brassica rapa subsp. trilocularis]